MQCGEVGRGVVRGAVAFLDERGVFAPAVFVLDEKGIVFWLPGFVGENAERAVALGGDAARDEFLDDGFELRIVKTFAECDVEVDGEAGVDAVEFLLGNADHFTPEREVFLAAVLQLYEFLADLCRGGWLRDPRVHPFVDLLQLLDGFRRDARLGDTHFPTDEEHTKLFSPVADVIVAHGFVADELSDARE